MFGRDADDSTDDNDVTHLAPSTPYIATPIPDPAAPPAASSGSFGPAPGIRHAGPPEPPAGISPVTITSATGPSDVPQSSARISIPVSHPDAADAMVPDDHLDDVLTEPLAPDLPDVYTALSYEHDHPMPTPHEPADDAVEEEEPELPAPTPAEPVTPPDTEEPQQPVASNPGEPAMTAAPAAQPADEPSVQDDEEEEEDDQAAPEPAADPTPAPTAAPSDSGTTGSLADIKRQALQQLAPLVSQLDLDPEEKFKTTLMMLQSTDDTKLITEVYEAAMAIPDDKARAQALLDVVNEINYLTRKRN
jgi:hypothetical protein